MSVDVREIAELVGRETPQLDRLRTEIARVIVGQKELLDRLLLALLCNQHVLIEGVPGLAKTLAVTSLARAVSASFQRLQFTPDLLPADLLGTLIYNPKTGEFTTKQGPIFANLILADEINRAPAKVQSALLEAMQERQVTLGDRSYPLPEPFLVLATQNPVEQEGTYPLPEAQVDRFMLKLVLTYPRREEEKEILRRNARLVQLPPASPVAGPTDIKRWREVVDAVYLDAKLEDYIVSLVEATRDPAKYNLPLAELIRYGASPRATICLALAAKAQAFLRGRGYVTPQDVKDIAPDVLRHRLIVTYEAEAEEKTSADLVAQILAAVPVP